MATTVITKHYKFTDPISHTQTKDVGWIATTDTRNSHKIWNEETQTWDTISDEPSQSVYEVKPHEAYSPQEISEADYNALDVSTESIKFRKKREQHVNQLASVLATVTA